MKIEGDAFAPIDVMRQAIETLTEVTFTKDMMQVRFRPHILGRLKVDGPTVVAGFSTSWGWYQVEIDKIVGVLGTSRKFKPDRAYDARKTAYAEILCAV